MPEYIERSKIAEMLNAVYKNGWCAKYSVEMYLNTAQRVLMTIPAADVGKTIDAGWISVKDRLPEENTPVLICTQWGDIWMASYYSECRIASKLFSPAHWDVETLRGGGIDFKAEDVTHWMPLPRLPEDEEDEDNGN